MKPTSSPVPCSRKERGVASIVRRIVEKLGRQGEARSDINSRRLTCITRYWFH
jgi:hypothetical protein